MALVTVVNEGSVRLISMGFSLPQLSLISSNLNYFMVKIGWDRIVEKSHILVYGVRLSHRRFIVLKTNSGAEIVTPDSDDRCGR